MQKRYDDTSLLLAHILDHGLDWRLMGAAPGIAGSAEPEVDGCFLSADEWGYSFFLHINNTGGPVDVWAVDELEFWGGTRVEVEVSRRLGVSGGGSQSGEGAKATGTRHSRLGPEIVDSPRDCGRLEAKRRGHRPRRVIGPMLKRGPLLRLPPCNVQTCFPLSWF